MTDSSLIVERFDGVAYLRFNRPKVLNALNVEMSNALLDACRSLATDNEVRVLVLTGMGRAFIAGGDLQTLRAAPEANATALLVPLHESIRLLGSMQAPVLASVHGVVAGAGMSLMLAADLAIAAEDTRFNFAYTNIGVSCDGGASWALPRLLGLRKALEIALLSESFDAAEALRLGLLNRVAPSAKLVEATKELAVRLASHEPHVLAHLKRLLRTASAQSQDFQLQAEQQAFIDCARRPQFVKAIDEFYARRA